MKSPIIVSIKSYVNFRGTGSQGFPLLALSKNHIGFLKEEGTEIRISRISLIVFSEKVVAILKGEGKMKEIPYRLY